MTHYDKILVEQMVMSQPDLPATVLRFPAVLGPNEYRRFQRWLEPMLRGDAELRIQDDWAAWSWTHGFAEDVAEAVVLAVTNSAAAGRIYNVGEMDAPAMAERLADFARVIGWQGRIVRTPASELPEADRMAQDFAHHLAYDTIRIRRELGYKEVVPHHESLTRTIELERAG
jgi:nucleoside-diphosphate-sugar epimerase